MSNATVYPGLPHLEGHLAKSVSIADADWKCRCARGNLSGATIWRRIDIVHSILVTHTSIQIQDKCDQYSEQ